MRDNLSKSRDEAANPALLARTEVDSLFFTPPSLPSSLSGLFACLVSFEVPSVPGLAKRNLLSLTLFVIIYTVGNECVELISKMAPVLAGEKGVMVDIPVTRAK